MIKIFKGFKAKSQLGVNFIFVKSAFDRLIEKVASSCLYVGL